MYLSKRMCMRYMFVFLVWNLRSEVIDNRHFLSFIDPSIYRHCMPILHLVTITSYLSSLYLYVVPILMEKVWREHTSPQNIVQSLSLDG